VDGDIHAKLNGPAEVEHQHVFQIQIVEQQLVNVFRGLGAYAF